MRQKLAINGNSQGLKDRDRFGPFEVTGVWGIGVEFTGQL
jgi:hypothetical protein